MTNKIFVGGLPWSTKESELQDAFGQFGTITEAKIITDRETGRSRGFGFITFEEESAIEQAISEMNGKEFGGRTIKVNQAQERAPRSGGGGGGRRGGFGGGGGGFGGGGGNRW